MRNILAIYSGIGDGNMLLFCQSLSSTPDASAKGTSPPEYPFVKPPSEGSLDLMTRLDGYAKGPFSPAHALRQSRQPA